jgi:hypothetical protein
MPGYPGSPTPTPRANPVSVPQGGGVERRIPMCDRFGVALRRHAMVPLVVVGSPALRRGRVEPFQGSRAGLIDTRPGYGSAEPWAVLRNAFGVTKLPAMRARANVITHDAAQTVFTQPSRDARHIGTYSGGVPQRSPGLPDAGGLPWVRPKGPRGLLTSGTSETLTGASRWSSPGHPRSLI